MASSDGESDEDFVPGEPEQLSEEESADEETDLQYEKEVEMKNQKRKAVEESNVKKKRKTTGRSTRNRKESENREVEDKKLPEENLDPEQEKKREDDLWAMFLEGTDTKPKAKETKIEEVAPKPVELSKPDISTNISKDNQTKVEEAAEKERRIFEFAGETIVVEGDVIKEKIKVAENPAAAAALKPASGSKSGLSAVLGQLNKKNKLSTLEKTKLDWMTFKKQEGIEEELKSINKGKDGYLERQDFLERADLRQYEIERELRTSRRSNR